jgi:glycosyltransferase involved in cell wall biosynthesis
VYGIDADLLPAPHSMDANAPRRVVPGVQPGGLLCVARLLPYKNVDAVVAAMTGREDQLVVVGDGPDRARLEHLAPANVVFAGTVDDDSLRWLYANSRALVAASFEDFGLTPLEAAAFARPTVALRAGGYLDTVVEGVTGTFFDQPNPMSISAGIDALDESTFDEDVVRTHADRFHEDAFQDRLRGIIAEELAA